MKKDSWRSRRCTQWASLPFWASIVVRVVEQIACMLHLLTPYNQPLSYRCAFPTRSELNRETYAAAVQSQSSLPVLRIARPLQHMPVQQPMHVVCIVSVET